MSEKKILALDMDGTALNDLGVLTPEVIQSIKLAQKNNCIVCFVTGRRDIDITPIQDQCKSADYLLMNNGAKILDVRQKKILFHKLLENEVVEKMVTYCLKNNILLYVTVGDFWAVNYVTDGVKRYALKLQSEPMVYHSYQDLSTKNIDGLIVTDSGAGVEKFIQLQKIPLYCLRSEPNCIDIIADGVGKWEAIELLARELKINHSNVIAVGNYNNDIDMIVKAGIGVAVANALEEVKVVANYVTMADNNHNAVKEIVDRFIIS